MISDMTDIKENNENKVHLVVLKYMYKILLLFKLIQHF